MGQRLQQASELSRRFIAPLHGLTINGVFAGSGILFNTAGNLAIENCVVRDHAAFRGCELAWRSKNSFYPRQGQGANRFS
jgi:hypothetical protein